MDSHLQRLLLEEPAVSKHILHRTLVVQHVQGSCLTLLLNLQCDQSAHTHTVLVSHKQRSTCTATERTHYWKRIRCHDTMTDGKGKAGLASEYNLFIVTGAQAPHHCMPTSLHKASPMPPT